MRYGIASPGDAAVLGIGLSLDTFGTCQTLAQGCLPGLATHWLGENAGLF